MKVLIDSDVCLDFLTGRKPHCYSANELFGHIYTTGLAVLASPDSLSNIFYILRQHYEVIKIVPKLKTLRSLIHVATLTEKHIDLALDSGWNDFEDAIQYYCAKENNCDAIITRNADDFSKSELLVFTPLDFLDRQY